mmetsp:Transcript_81321/g.235094  ORF Transcript_81321/g.235094 Transcript_81321/m.235094 type:complete len:334 (-) Transcript_81321:133-1134(-)
MHQIHIGRTYALLRVLAVRLNGVRRMTPAGCPRRRAALRFIEEARHQLTRLDLRITLAPGPSARETLADDGHPHCRPATWRPSGVTLVHFEAPLPNALSQAELPGELLLQPILHAHQGRLSLGQHLLTTLRLVAGPVHRRQRDLTPGHDLRARVHEELLLVPWALQVPEHAPRGVVARRNFRGVGLTSELVQHTQKADVYLHRAQALGPRRMPPELAAAAHGLGLAVGLQSLGLRGASIDVRPVAARPIAQQLLAPAPHEEGQRPLGRVPLRELLRRHPIAGHVVGDPVQQEPYDAAELEAREARHAVVIAPMEDRPVLRSLELPRALQEFLQ